MKRKVPPECPVCLGECNDEIHQATRRVHRWFHGRVMLSLRPVEIAQAAKKPRPAILPPWVNKPEPVEEVTNADVTT